jgi:hypothetical protein
VITQQLSSEHLFLLDPLIVHWDQVSSAADAWPAEPKVPFLPANGFGYAE